VRGAVAPWLPAEITLLKRFAHAIELRRARAQVQRRRRAEPDALPAQSGGVPMRATLSQPPLTRLGQTRDLRMECIDILYRYSKTIHGDKS
jgi:hypothetical protein